MPSSPVARTFVRQGLEQSKRRGPELLVERILEAPGFDTAGAYLLEAAQQVRRVLAEGFGERRRDAERWPTEALADLDLANVVRGQVCSLAAAVRQCKRILHL